MGYIFEDPSGTGGNASVTKDQVTGALGGSGLDQSAQQSVYNSLFPKVTASSGSGSGSSGGGSSAPIDWASLINNDPIYRQSQADAQAGSTADAATRAANIRSALAQWGIVPDFTDAANRLGLSPDALKFLQSDVNDETRSLADKNTKEGLSIFARLQKQHNDNLRNLKRALAARGLASSGETGYGIGEENLQYKQSTTDNEQKMLQYITGAVSAFQQAEQARKRDLAGSMSDAANRVFNEFGSSSGGGGSGGGSGGGGGGGGPADPNDFQYGSTLPQGYSLGDVWSAAVAGAPQGAKPMHLMSQGMVQNGQVSIKYLMPNGQTNTIWVPLGQAASAGGGGGGSTSSEPVSGQVSQSNPFGLSIA